MRKKDSMHYVSEYKLQLHCLFLHDNTNKWKSARDVPTLDWSPAAFLWLMVVAGNSSCMHACRVDGPGLESSSRRGAPIHGTLRL